MAFPKQVDFSIKNLSYEEIREYRPGFNYKHQFNGKTENQPIFTI